PDVVTIRTSAGSVHENVRALVESAKGRIFTSRSDIPITPGDKIIRRTPAGVEEVFTVVDPGLHAGLSGIPATYQMTVRRDDSPLKPTRSGTVIYNVTGTGARFNID